MNVCTRLYQDISLKTKNVSFMVVLMEKSRDHQSHQFVSSSVDKEYLYKISWQSIQELLKYFSQNQSEPTDWHYHP